MSGNINIINFEKPRFNIKNLFKKKISSTNLDKSTIRILFIDDDVDDFPVIQNLKDAGWSVEACRDIQNIEDDIVKRSHIIFVDYKGVGKNFSEREQGIGLIKILKDTYKNTKRIILYSGHNRFSLGDQIDVADTKLPKNADTREFIEIIKKEMKKIQ